MDSFPEELSRNKAGPPKNRVRRGFWFVGVPGIEPGSLRPFFFRAAGSCTQVLPTPRANTTVVLQPVYFLFARALIHLAQAKTLFPRKRAWSPRGFTPEANLTHCKFGYFLFLMVGLYFPLNFTLLPTITPRFPQIAHCFAMNLFNL